MAHEYNISESGLDLIKAYEGFRPVETILVSGQKVIGYGHPYVRGEAALLTQKKAEEILKSDLEPIEKIINHIVFAPLSQNQFDALVSLAFNIGIDDFADSSVLHYLNNGQPLAAAAGFDEWRKSVIADQTYVIDALVRRRTAEKALFLNPEFGIVAAPRYEIPVLHDDTVNTGGDDIEVFSEADVDGFVDQAPYEDEPSQEHPVQEGAGAAALMLSERVAAPQIYEDTLEDAAVVDLVVEDDVAEEAVIDNVVDIKPDAEIEVEIDDEINTESESEPELSIEAEAKSDNENTTEIESETKTEVEPEGSSEDEEEFTKEKDLSPIALAAADVSERLDNLMEEAETEADVEASEDGIVAPESLEFNSENVAVAEIVTTDEPEAVESETLEAEAVEAEVVETATEETDTSKPETAKSETTEIEGETEAETKSENKLEQPAPVVVKKEKVKGAGAFWTALVVGLLLIAASLWQMKFSPVVNLGAMGEFLAPVVLLVGAMMIMGGMFYMVKAQLRSTSG